MINKKDIIIGCVYNYDYNKIKNFSKSLIDVNFTGDKYMITYNINLETIKKLQNDGFIVY